MYAHRLEFSFDGQELSGKLLDSANAYLGTLRMNGQILGREWPLYLENNKCISSVLAPAKDSLDEKYSNLFVEDCLAEAKKSGVSIASRPLGEDVDSADGCGCLKPTGYVMYTTYLSLESPIRCMDCFGPVPLYKLPIMPSGDYSEIIRWQSDYQACDALQMNCTVLERSSTRQLSDVRSTLSKVGRENSDRLSAQMGKPVYYYLYRASGKSLSSERERRCSSCSEPWYIENALHSLFHFKCYKCRLLSNLAFNISE
ncbi:DUF2310 family Zn-ribbon-containing protein [Paraherbaspirillum soli]|uniref:DUF2310 family Zn-ribbon-containing protein n=1 Tax=Paraherbaspirillum soli TaxID=631222 RepID=A0ABW0MAY6_9BURK